MNLQATRVTDLLALLLCVESVAVLLLVAPTKLVLLAALAVVVEEPKGKKSSTSRPLQRLETVTAVYKEKSLLSVFLIAS